jgi:hypothetical protein
MDFTYIKVITSLGRRFFQFAFAFMMSILTVQFRRLHYSVFCGQGVQDQTVKLLKPMRCCRLPNNQ